VAIPCVGVWTESSNGGVACVSGCMAAASRRKPVLCLPQLCACSVGCWEMTHAKPNIFRASTQLRQAGQVGGQQAVVVVVATCVAV
jgi:hypothetical protein